ncbi:MAG TPA: PRC-barrel domain-containing protein [Dehalococcoidia bacterium]|nr:PRC-barrel domain-containing protein [Dehalococcoidia bacterium]
MLRPASALFRYPVIGMDGPLGDLHDLYVDDRTWVARHVVVRTRGMPPRRSVLIPPSDVQKPFCTDSALRVLHMRDELRAYPEAEMEPPVAAQDDPPLRWEEAKAAARDLRRRASEETRSLMEKLRLIFVADEYGGARAAPPARLHPPAPPSAFTVQPVERDRHLQSVRSLRACAVAAQDGRAGRVRDVLIDDDAWSVRFFEVQTRAALGHRVLVPAALVRGVLWPRRTIEIDGSARELRAAPAFDDLALRARSYGPRLFGQAAGDRRHIGRTIGGRLR